MRCDDRGAPTSARPFGLVVFLVVACASVAKASNAYGSSAAGAPGELRLPPDVAYELAIGPDSAVVFSHQTHVALAGNRCTACHPQTFRILAPTKHIAHGDMDAGRSCGTCHDGRRAFGVRDSSACSSCHSGRRTVAAPAAEKGRAGARVASRGPAPIIYSRSKASPGPVTFLHAAHVEKSPCASCHPRPFAMKVAQPSATPLHEPSACGMCHDGSRAFGVGDPEACDRCHAAGRETP